MSEWRKHMHRQEKNHPLNNKLLNLFNEQEQQRQQQQQQQQEEQQHLFSTTVSINNRNHGCTRRV